MGYYSQFKVTFEEGSKIVQDLLDGVELHIPSVGSCYHECLIVNTENTVFETEDETKWYGCVDDFKALTKKYPLELVIVYVEGEEQGDVHYEYFRSGKHYSQGLPKPAFLPFDDKKLK